MVSKFQYLYVFNAITETLTFPIFQHEELQNWGLYKQRFIPPRQNYITFLRHLETKLWLLKVQSLSNNVLIITIFLVGTFRL